MRITVKSLADTEKIAIEIATFLKNNGGVIALSGELGAGKTTFVQMMAKSLGIEEKVISPTFVIIRQHQIPQTDDYLFHLDVYRLEENSDSNLLGLDDFIVGKNIIVVEWAEKIKQQLPDDTIWINITQDKNERIFDIKNFKGQVQPHPLK